MLLPAAVYKKTGNKESKRSTPKVYQFSGYNANSVIKPGELKAMTNCGSDNYPCISNRGSRSLVSLVTTPNALFSANGVRIEVDGTSFKYNAVAKGTVTSGIKSMVDFNGRVLIFPDKKYYDYIGDTFGDIGTGTYPAAGSCPAIDFACVHSNRVFGIKGSDIYASKLGDCMNWTTFTEGGNSQDSYATDVASGGLFVGITSYQNHVVMFKKDLIYELYGDVPGNFFIKEISNKGCIDGKSISEVNGLLYFLARDGVNSYGGGLPRLISYELNQTYVSGAAGTDGRKYYISMYNGTAYDLFVYDTLHGLWHREDALSVVEFAVLDGSIRSMRLTTIQ